MGKLVSISHEPIKHPTRTAAALYRIGAATTEGLVSLGLESREEADAKLYRDTHITRRRGLKAVGASVTAVALVSVSSLALDIVGDNSNRVVDQLMEERESCIEAIDDSLPNVIIEQEQNKCLLIGTPAQGE